MLLYHFIIMLSSAFNNKMIYCFIAIIIKTLILQVTNTL